MATTPSPVACRDGGNDDITDDHASSRTGAAAAEKAREVIRNGGTQAEAIAAAKEIARGILSPPRTLGIVVEARDAASSNETGRNTQDATRDSPSSNSNAAKDKAANKDGTIPISYIVEKSETVSVLTTPRQDEMIFHRGTNVRNNVAISDYIFQIVSNFVDAMDENIFSRFGDLGDSCSSLCSESQQSLDSERERLNSEIPIGGNHFEGLNRGVEYHPHWRHDVVDTVVGSACQLDPYLNQQVQQPEAKQSSTGRLPPLSPVMLQKREVLLPRALQYSRSPSPYQLHPNNAGYAGRRQHLSYARNSVAIDQEQRRVHHYPQVPISRDSSLQISACESIESVDETQDRYAGMKQEDVETRDIGTLVNSDPPRPSRNGMADANRQVMMGMHGVQRVAHDNDAIRNNDTHQAVITARPPLHEPRFMDRYPSSTVTFSNRDKDSGHPVMASRQSSPNIMLDNVDSPYKDVRHVMNQGQQSHLRQQGQQTVQPFGQEQFALPLPKRTMLV